MHAKAPRRLLCWLVLGASFVGTNAARARKADAIELTLQVGEQQLVPSEGVVSFSEGTEGVVDVRMTQDGSRFVVVGKRVGRTTLLLLMRDGKTRLYRIEVRDAPSEELGEGTVEPRHNVRLDFFFVQLDSMGNRDMGVRWPAQLGTSQLAFGYDLVAGALTRSTAVVNSAIMPTLEMAESRGWAKILRRASVITASGTSADFSSGGEVNIPVVNAVSAGFEAIQFGSTVKVSPRYDEKSGRIELVVEAQVADLSTSPGSDIPGRTTATLHTLVNMELGQTLVLAGLSARSEGRSRTGVPGLSQVPILGGLFGKHARRRSETENVIYIIPSLVEAMDSERREELTRALDAYEEFSGRHMPTPPPSVEGRP